MSNSSIILDNIEKKKNNKFKDENDNGSSIIYFHLYHGSYLSIYGSYGSYLSICVAEFEINSN